MGHSGEGQEAIFLDARGYVTESTASNLGMVRRGEILTSPCALGLLSGLTVFRIKRWSECKTCKICEKTCEWGAIRGPIIVKSECVRIFKAAACENERPGG